MSMKATNTSTDKGVNKSVKGNLSKSSFLQDVHLAMVPGREMAESETDVSKVFREG